MTNDDLQFAISQYVDGMLPPDEAAVLEKRVAEDADARRLLAEYRRLNALIAGGLRVPDVDWDTLAHKISRAVDTASPSVSAEVMGQSEQTPTYRLAWAWRPFAIAASLLICAGLAVIFLHQEPAPQTAKTDESPIPPLVIVPPSETQNIQSSVRVLVADAAGGPAVADIQIGPSQSARSAPIAQFYPEIATAEPASVSIAGVPLPSRDEDAGILQ